MYQTKAMNKEFLKWYVVYTRPCHEKRVAELLAEKEIGHYCPLQKVQRQWSDRKKIILEPLFKSYVFVHITEKGQMPVRQTEGVINFVNFLGKPAVIRDEEISVIRQFLNDYQHVQLEKIELHINEKVTVTGGPLMMQEGIVVQIKSRTAKVLLPSLGFALIAEIDKSNLGKLPLLAQRLCR
jgi:transcriptional antiterminator NusG